MQSRQQYRLDGSACLRSHMRVSIVSHTYTVAANRGKIAALCAGDGVICQLITPHRWADTLTAVDVAPGSGTHVVLRARLVGKGALYWMPLRRLLTEIRSFAPDLLHVEEEPYAITALWCALVAARLRVPLTVFTWDNLQRRLPLPFEAIRRFVLARAAYAIAGNSDAARLLPTWGFRGPVSIIPQLGVALPSDVPRRSETGRFCIGYIGRLVPDKGVSLLLEALAAIDGATLRIVGKGPDEDRLRQQAQTLGVASRVTFTGGVPHERVGEQLPEMDVLVLPSLTTARWKEQFGHVLIEAMACGVPVVGSSSGAIPEVIGHAGLVFAEGRADRLVTALRQLGNFPVLRRCLATAGPARVVANYTDAVLARRTFAAWEVALRRGTEGHHSGPEPLGTKPCAA